MAPDPKILSCRTTTIGKLSDTVKTVTHTKFDHNRLSVFAFGLYDGTDTIPKTILWTLRTTKHHQKYATYIFISTTQMFTIAFVLLQNPTCRVAHVNVS